jgi:uncharacterized membrane protein (DUF373 family)
MKHEHHETRDAVNVASDAIRRAKPLILRLYDLIVDGIIIGSVLLMLVALLYSFFDVLDVTAHIAAHLHSLSADDMSFRSLVTNVLDIFIVIELFSTFTGYARTRHIKLSPLLDVTIVFALREILIKLYANSFAVRDLIGLCIVVIILVMARSMSVNFSPLRWRGASDENPDDKAAG